MTWPHMHETPINDDLDRDLNRYHLYHAARGDLLERMGRHDDAVVAYDTALSLTENEAERELLRNRKVSPCTG